MRQRSASVIASAARMIPVVILMLTLFGCSPNVPEATVNETTVPDPVSDASTENPVLASEPAAPEASLEAPADGGPAPVLVVETAKGTIEIETYPNEAPKTVEHIVALANRRFYNGLRVHRAVPGFVVQFGDPQTRDMTKRARWGSQGSGNPIGVSEVNPRRRHRLGAVAAAHAGDPRRADSQMYISFAPQPKLDPDYTVFGQVISGIDVAQKLAVNDIIRRVTVKP